MMKIILNSLPKSGTHLLGRFLDLIGFKRIRPYLTGRLIRPTNINPIKLIRKYFNKDKKGLWIDLENKSGKIKSSIIKKILNEKALEGTYRQAHLPYSVKMKNILKINNHKILYIFRDPRDVAISHINWVLKQKGHPEFKKYLDSTISERLKLSLFGIKHKRYGYLGAPLSERVMNSIGWIRDDYVCSFSFEDLIGPEGGGLYRNQIKTIHKILKFLKIQKRDNEVRIIRDKLFYKKSSTFNKGLIGQWKELFSYEDKLMFKKEIGNLLIELGYEKNKNW